MMKHILKTLVGLVVTFLFIVLVIGYPANSYYVDFGHRLKRSVEDTLILFFVSIGCTAGLSLILWIPLWYGVGWIVFEIVGWLPKILKGKPANGIRQTEPATSKLQKKPGEAARQPKQQSAASLTRDQQALVNYIKKAKEKGLPNHQITQNLTNNGWAIDNIAAAFQMTRNGA